MKEKSVKSYSIRMFLFYFFIVFFLVFLSLAYKFYLIIKASRFDYNHRFTLAIAEEKGRVNGLVTFEPQVGTSGMILFKGAKFTEIENIPVKMGVVVDGYIIANNNLLVNGSMSDLWREVLFEWVKLKKNVTIYDALRFWYYSGRVAYGSYQKKVIDLDKKNVYFDNLISRFFIDNEIVAENVSVQIVNAAGKSGLGGRLERLLSNMGINVVSVRTALDDVEVSNIKYFHDGSYTFKRINRILGYKLERLKREDIADIIIILGKDQNRANRF